MRFPCAIPLNRAFPSPHITGTTWAQPSYHFHCCSVPSTPHTGMKASCGGEVVQEAGRPPACPCGEQHPSQSGVCGTSGQEAWSSDTSPGKPEIRASLCGAHSLKPSCGRLGVSFLPTPQPVELSWGRTWSLALPRCPLCFREAGWFVLQPATCQFCGLGLPAPCPFHHPRTLPAVTSPNTEDWSPLPAPALGGGFSGWSKRSACWARVYS